MKNSILYIFIVIMMITVPRVFADTDSNSDFNPFPQMEQDLSNTDDQAASAPQQNDDNDGWPPANSEEKHD